VGWRGAEGRDSGGNVTNIQYKINENCPYESPLYDKYILIKKLYIQKKLNTDPDPATLESGELKSAPLDSLKIKLAPSEGSEFEPPPSEATLS
jgi:hypothetical protein